VNCVCIYWEVERGQGHAACGRTAAAEARRGVAWRDCDSTRARHDRRRELQEFLFLYRARYVRSVRLLNCGLVSIIPVLPLQPENSRPGSRVYRNRESRPLKPTTFLGSFAWVKTDKVSRERLPRNCSIFILLLLDGLATSSNGVVIYNLYVWRRAGWLHQQTLCLLVETALVPLGMLL